MKCILLGLLIFASFSFTKIPNEDGPVTLENEGAWKSNFKNEVFKKILYKMYGIDIITCCFSKDASSTANWDWLNYDSLTEKSIAEIVDVFMTEHSIGGEIEGVPVKLNFALAFRISQELDSLTGIHYKRYQRDSTINSEAYYNNDNR